MKINIDSTSSGRPTGDLFGLFFEDLNHAGDGGLYAELVQNRSFEFDPIDNKEDHPLTAWEKVEYGDSNVFLHVDMADPLNRNNLHYLVMEIPYACEGAGIKNIGYGKGMAVKKDAEYAFSCFYKRSTTEEAPIEVKLENRLTGECLGQSAFMGNETQWTKASLMLCANADCDTAQLVLICKEPIKLKLDMVSLFPVDTFMGRPGGLRRDIAELLRDMKPKFMRFPGGCLTHIGSLDAEDRDGMYRWKNTIGPVEERPARRNNWGYNQTFGLGFYELFQLCEDIGAQPLPVISAGCDPHAGRAAPMDEMQEWIDDALDLIAFANGDIRTKWGGRRASMGHEAPFNLKYLAIGNEEVGEEFFQRYELMCREIKKVYPDILLIGSGGPGHAGNQFDRGWATARRTATAFVDEHFYQAPEWFIDNAERYKAYSAEGPRAFLGEYASCGDTYFNALAEAAFMIGMEKSPGIGLACYAPMLCHEEYVNWTPNMLWYDNKTAYGTASYHVQRMFMEHQGESNLPITETDLPKVHNAPMIASGGAYLHSAKDSVVFDHAVIRSLSAGKDFPLPVYYGTNQEEADKIAAVIDENSYEIHFDVRRSAGKHYDDLEGRNGFFLSFGIHSPEERFEWRMNSWQRLTGITQIVNNSPLSMQSNLYPFEIGRSDHCRLVVNGEEIQAFINDELVGGGRTVRAKQQGVFCSAAYDGGDLIVKAVNLFDRTEKAEIYCNDGEFSGSARLIQLAGYLPDDRNSLENPEKIKPVTAEIAAEGNRLAYNLPPLSFTIFRIACSK